jgi:hypothetical protein
LLKGRLNKECNHDLKGDHEESTDQNDKLQFVNSLDYFIHPRLHHYTSHFEIEIEKSSQKRDNHD